LISFRKHISIILFFFILFSCSDSGHYKRFSLKDLFSNSDSVTKYNDSIAAIRKLLDADENQEALTKLIDQKSRWNNFNGCVLVAQHGYVIFKKAYGYANYKQKINLQTTTSFNLASTSKTFTAVGIMLLKQQGKLSYDDDVKKYIPDFPYEGITIKQLLTHRSGLPNYMYFSYQHYDEFGQNFDNDMLIEMMIKYKPEPYAKPDKRFRYCNTNYAILASIIEKVDERSYANFMYHNIFVPLQMENTWVSTIENDTTYTNKTIAYSGNWRVEEKDFLDNVYGDKGIFSNVEDLLKWDQSFYNNKILTKETLDEAFKAYSKEKKGANNYGYGFRIIDNKDGSKIVYHNGWWHCYTTSFYRRLSDKTAIIILSNKYNKGIYNISEILNILGSKLEESSIELE